ncbi:MAG: hypothetical protein K9L64_04550, partial [Candidatus Izimaplasma sp.]|nr:hypothetical protein [Candidatus Izimaplasma bacterium]
MDDKIHNYLVAIGSNDLDKKQMQIVAQHIDTITDYERIGDHLENILELFFERKEDKITLNKDGRKEITNLFELIRKSMEQAKVAYFNNDIESANNIIEREDEIDRLVKEYRVNHINRINDQNVEGTASGYYVDILSNLERIADHLENIALNTVNDTFSYHSEIPREE